MRNESNSRTLSNRQKVADIRKSLGQASHHVDISPELNLNKGSVFLRYSENDEEENPKFVTIYDQMDPLEDSDEDGEICSMNFNVDQELVFDHEDRIPNNEFDISNATVSSLCLNMDIEYYANKFGTTSDGLAMLILERANEKSPRAEQSELQVVPA